MRHLLFVPVLLAFAAAAPFANYLVRREDRMRKAK